MTMRQQIDNKYKGHYAKFLKTYSFVAKKKNRKRITSEEYKDLCEFYLSMFTDYWWTGLVAFIYNNEEIQSECYWRILETMEHIYNLKLYRGKRKKLLRTVIYKQIKFNQQIRSNHNWWGDEVPYEVANEIRNEIDNIIDVLSHSSNLVPKQYLDNYISKLEMKWQRQ